MATDQLDLGFHGDRELAAGLTDLAVNVRPGPPPPWLRAAVLAAVDDLAAAIDGSTRVLTIMRADEY